MDSARNRWWTPTCPKMGERPHGDPRAAAATLSDGSSTETEEALATIVVGVDRSLGGQAALDVANELSKQLGLRLVIAHVAAGFRMPEGGESVTSTKARQGAARLLDELAREHGLGDDVDRRGEVGDIAERLASIAAEEGADLIIVGSRRRGRRRWKLVNRLLADLSASTTRPVLVVPPSRG
jgi:nucleotide-binding universal stress UspA family protein